MKIMKSAKTQSKVAAPLAGSTPSQTAPPPYPPTASKNRREGREWRRFTDRPRGEEGGEVRRKERKTQKMKNKGKYVKRRDAVLMLSDQSLVQAWTAHLISKREMDFINRKVRFSIHM